MRYRQPFALTLLLLMCANTAFSKTWEVPIDADLQLSINRAQAGDILLLPNTTFFGNFIIDRALTLDGQNHTVIDALGSGNAITVASEQVTITQLTINNWGDDLTETHAGIKIRNTYHAEVTNNTLQGDGFGIYLESATDSLVHGNHVRGNADMRSSDRGNGIHLTNVQRIKVSNNDVQYTRDGLYIINSQNNELIKNQLRDLRFGIHYMYSHNNTVTDNRAMDVKVGYALMSSNNLTIHRNQANGCDDYGLLLNFVNGSSFEYNNIENVRSPFQPPVQGDEGKALFVYNSTNNTFQGNNFAHSDMGIHLTAGSEGNVLFENQFVDNEVQVKYVSTREQEWSHEGVGNYWSNYVGWDLDSNGIGDSVFEPNDDIDKLLWKYPEAKVLMDSPAVLLLRWVQRSFPILKSPGVTDSFPQVTIQKVNIDG